MRKAQLYRYQIPVETGVILRHRRLKQREGLVVKLTEDNQVGWGEIAPLPEFSQEDLSLAQQQTEQWLAKWLAGQQDDLDSYVPSVAFGLSCALAELNGELAEQGNYRAAVLCYGDPDELYTELNALEGDKIGKMKVGLYEANRDGLIANMLLEALPDLQLRLDANRGWTLEKAVKFAEKIANENKSRIQFIEEPCKTPELSRLFAQASGIAIAWDETVREPNFVVKNEPNVTAIVIKPTLVGSLQKCIRLIEQAHQQGLIAVISSSIESSLGLTQLARFAQQYTPQTTPGLDTLDLMQYQLLRPWKDSNLPIAELDSPFVQEIML
ncbi:o-succinylbenzoate synthase [Actinobacillus equuli subsp. haemolyticus]|uniref:o-succinylbenzoate synthase n=1 Tax=Actinobacillus equuli TaxID=718 RepID=A0AAX3FLJ3_ACTEU|nr:o-succinylbenzoate synthase [Actinobacillus equuli]AIZ78619.1 O-succinylbenzoate synthase [Actinobacillus equuli subsp. equuli]WGE44882.1 o-succinylbenzoate synthase [Actinobacillus equuli subsp. equuli]WGE61770.1 o-succinylbenzoate synthase [Actinobacillus equuli subsp. haemolyticus]WGE65846.1 o-succinylbenzoate synthase [Actinobacillus equuli subsp. equuli]WGE66457.1 o-succinylbenzoate synthase [Actinobacillus equuli subsp. haemolyticus]